jgi:hypothetical protein
LRLPHRKAQPNEQKPRLALGSTILDFIKSPIQTVTLNDGQSFIQHVVDVETLSSILKKGVSANHPDADVIDGII